jgi:hypothetical protein
MTGGTIAPACNYPASVFATGRFTASLAELAIGSLLTRPAMSTPAANPESSASLTDVTLFVGAGISRDSGLPDFRQLRDFFLRPILGEEVEEIEMSDLSPEQIFDALDDGLPATREAIRRAMWQACEPHEPNPNHYALALLGQAGASLWTPNFDTLIERAAERLGIGWDTRVSEIEQNSPLRQHELTVNKVHGTFPYRGDPPSEPPRHSYPLLFARSQLWGPPGDGLLAPLIASIEGRRVFILGYRGADLDIMPILLAELGKAAEVEWWESDLKNCARLTELFAGFDHIRIEAGDPSARLRELPAAFGQVAALPDTNPLGAPWNDAGSYTGRISHRDRAAVLGQFRGSPYARSQLLSSILFDPAALRADSALALTRSVGFDRPLIGSVLVRILGAALRFKRFNKRQKLWELYAAILDALPLRSADEGAMRQLTDSPFADSGPVLVRLASKQKRMGRLDMAADAAQRAQADLHGLTPPRPALEAMTAYNLLWIYRQQWNIDARQRLLETFRDRLAHVGFNWLGWIGLEEALFELSVGNPERARAILEDPRMRYVRRIDHPLFIFDDGLARILLDWTQCGPAGIDDRLGELARRHHRRGRLHRGAYSRINALLLLADHARATSRPDTMKQLLRTVRSDTRSALQRTQATLVEAIAYQDATMLARLQRDRRFGLIAETAQVGFADGRSRLGVARTPAGPLPALF